MAARYDTLGIGYANLRVPDTRIADQLHRAIGDADDIVNIGAGTGSYEPEGRHVIAVEPSSTMIAQRPPSASPVVQATAEALPFCDDLFQCAMGVLTLHHWRDWRRGVAEALRVAQGKLVLLTWLNEDLPVWLYDYFPDMQQRDLDLFPSLEAMAEELGPLRMENVPIPHDCSDGFLCAYWRRPEAYLRSDVRRSISLFAMIEGVDAGLAKLAADLDSGEWQRRYADLLARENMDFGYRIISTRP